MYRLRKANHCGVHLATATWLGPQRRCSSGHSDSQPTLQRRECSKSLVALDQLAHPKPIVLRALAISVTGGLVIEIVTSSSMATPPYQKFAKIRRDRARVWRSADCNPVPQPLRLLHRRPSSLPGNCSGSQAAASSPPSGTGWSPKQKQKTPPPAHSSDMSTMSLIGGGLIAGDSLAALGLGLFGLISQLTGN